MSGLTGKRVVITRAEHQATELASVLAEYGAIPLVYPCLAVLPPADTAPLDDALRHLASFDWLLLTSANTVDALARRLAATDLIVPPSLRVGAVGPATARLARTVLGVEVNVLPEHYNAAALTAALPDLERARMLVPQSDLADDALARGLAAEGAEVCEVVAYRMGIGSGGVDLPRLLVSHDVDAVTLTSGSAVTNLLARLVRENGDTARLADVVIACIGERTAEAARHWKLPVAVIAAPHTVAGLCAALDDFYSLPAQKRVMP